MTEPLSETLPGVVAVASLPDKYTAFRNLLSVAAEATPDSFPRACKNALEEWKTAGGNDKLTLAGVAAAARSLKHVRRQVDGR